MFPDAQLEVTHDGKHTDRSSCLSDLALARHYIKKSEFQ